MFFLFHRYVKTIIRLSILCKMKTIYDLQAFIQYENVYYFIVLFLTITFCFLVILLFEDYNLIIISLLIYYILRSFQSQIVLLINLIRYQYHHNIHLTIYLSNFYFFYSNSELINSLLRSFN